jgi:hypothetical protein
MLYAGIGSRRAPPLVLQLAKKIASRLANMGYILRSGAADGMDTAFENGCMESSGRSEIWLPWRGYNNHADTGLYPQKQHFDLAESLHPVWFNLSRGPKSLHARNIGIILGDDLLKPVSFVVCWTPDGCESESTRNKKTGGTATGIVLADRKTIPVFNLNNKDALERLKNHLAK